MIGQFSLDVLNYYNDSTYLDYFVETTSGSNCATHPNGRFIVPKYGIGGTYYGSPGYTSGTGDVPGSGGSYAYPLCGRSYFDTIGSTIQWLA